MRVLEDCTATTVRAVRLQTDKRPTVLRSKSRSKEFWTFQNSILRLKSLLRPYGDLCDRPRPHCDHTGTAVRPYCDLTRFALKIGRSTVAIRSQPRCDRGITKFTLSICMSILAWISRRESDTKFCLGSSLPYVVFAKVKVTKQCDYQYRIHVVLICIASLRK